ncbi:unnamed protein product [Rotaria sp. Silwood2]|nr:unnamed protein product [Rotaria sp. Silwood2]
MMYDLTSCLYYMKIIDQQFESNKALSKLKKMLKKKPDPPVDLSAEPRVDVCADPSVEPRVNVCTDISVDVIVHAPADPSV